MNIITLADKVIEYCVLNGTQISHLKLQKVMYYIQGWFSAYYPDSPVFDELPEAWVNGPVYVSIYDKFKDQISIRSDLSTLPAYASLNIEEVNFSEFDFTEDQLQLLDKILGHYTNLSDGELVSATHSEKPWQTARIGLKSFQRSNNTITYESISSYFSEWKSKADSNNQ
jgi:uncharacterized phage-associated protein